jgi:hypothetical protein
MTDQNTQFFAILTAVGEAKQANAAALGTSWTFAQMAVGDANGTDPIPSRTQTKLINERRRAPLNQVKVDPTNASVIIAEQIIPESVGGWWVRELALYDADGDMVAIANCAPTFKPLLAQGSGRTQVIRINLIVSGTANIELKIDPSVVLATREYVDTVVVEALSKLDYKHSVLAATTANIVLSGIQTIDGELLPVGARVLVKDQVQAKDNGIYVVPAAGVWKRAQDADTSVEVTPGLFVNVEKGTANGDSVWQLVTDAPIVLGTTALLFEMIAGRTGVITGTYRSVTVDKLGRVIAGTTPTKLVDYGIEIPTQVEAEAQSDQDNTKPMTALRVWQAIVARVTQATETAFGWAKVATQNQTNSGSDDTAFITPKKFSTALAALIVQATEQLSGIAKVATQTQVVLGTDDATIVTPKKMRFGFQFIKGPNGAIVLPTWLGGFIFQWGQASDVPRAGSGLGPTRDITLPVVFPNAAFSVWATYAFSNMTSTSAFAPGSEIISNSVVRVQNNYTSSAGEIRWYAIGY